MRECFIYALTRDGYWLTHGDAMNEEEQRSLSIVISYQEKEGHRTIASRLNQARMLKRTFDFVDSGEIERTREWMPIPGYAKGMSSRQYFDQTIHTIRTNLSSLNIEKLNVMRKVLALGAFDMLDMKNKTAGNDGVPASDFIDHINQKNLELRRAVIDEINRRNDAL